MHLRTGAVTETYILYVLDYRDHINHTPKLMGVPYNTLTLICTYQCEPMVHIILDINTL